MASAPPRALAYCWVSIAIKDPSRERLSTASSTSRVIAYLDKRGKKDRTTLESWARSLLVCFKTPFLPSERERRRRPMDKKETGRRSRRKSPLLKVSPLCVCVRVSNSAEARHGRRKVLLSSSLFFLILVSRVQKRGGTSPAGRRNKIHEA